jgi:hypothetical protein
LNLHKPMNNNNNNKKKTNGTTFLFNKLILFYLLYIRHKDNNYYFKNIIYLVETGILCRDGYYFDRSILMYVLSKYLQSYTIDVENKIDECFFLFIKQFLIQKYKHLIFCRLYPREVI